MALLAGLVLLMAISLLALAAAGSTLLQQRMAGNFADSQRALRLAEAALRQGERAVFALTDEQRIAGCTAACYDVAAQRVIYAPGVLPPNPENQSLEWWQVWGLPASASDGAGTGSSAATFSPEPLYFLIEEAHFQSVDSVRIDAPELPIDGIGYYRVLGRAAGMGPGSVVVQESILARPWGTGLLPEGGAKSDQEACAAVPEPIHCGQMSWRRRR